MPRLQTLMNVALGYGAKAERRTGPRYRTPSETLSYGAHDLHALDIHQASAGEAKPLLAFIHGGAWQFGDKARRARDRKVPFAHDEGWHFAALNFRLLPEVGVIHMAQDVARALAKLFAEAGRLGIDPQRVVLAGHSSGAHLAALVASDPALLGAHGLAPDMLAGVLAIDGAAYDPSRPSTQSRFLSRRLIDPAFAGTQRDAISPIAQIRQGRASIPPFLILSAKVKRGETQSRLLARELNHAGHRVRLREFDERGIAGHVRLSRRFGRPDYGPTEIAREWLRERLA